MSLVIISTKLFYPFDDKNRYPQSLSDPAAQAVDWDNWVEIQGAFDLRRREGTRLGKGHEIETNEMDALTMAPSQLDDYMDWYEKMWIEKKGIPWLGKLSLFITY